MVVLLLLVNYCSVLMIVFSVQTVHRFRLWCSTSPPNQTNCLWRNRTSLTFYAKKPMVWHHWHANSVHANIIICALSRHLMADLSVLYF